MLRTLARAALLAVLAGVAAPPTATATGPVDVYVALGDSFAAGPLIGAPVPDVPGCLRSDRNYPHLVAGTLARPLRDASCIGATTGAMTAPQEVSPPPPNPPQFDRLDADTATVTVTVGGNDIGYLDILVSCFTGSPDGSPCQDRYVVGGVDEISDRIAAAAPDVGAVLQGIRDRAPGATILLVGYLSVFPETGIGCFPQVPIADADVAYLRDKEQELNAMLAAQAAANDATFVDAGAGSRGHDACQAEGVRWVEPVAGATGGAPMHPNGLGMECTAVMVIDRLAPGAGAGTTLCRPPPEPVRSTPRFTG